MQVNWSTEKEKNEAFETLEKYRLGHIFDLLKDDPEQLQQIIDMLGVEGVDAEEVTEQLSS